MERIITWLKNHQSLIIGVLLAVVMLKGCSSCNMKRQHEFQISEMIRSEVQLVNTIDSMQTVINNCSMDSRYLCDTIYSLRKENTVLKEVIKDIRADKEYYKSQNKNLTNVAENLSKKDTIK